MGDFAYTVALSLMVSLSATAIAAAIGLPLGAALAIYSFAGRRFLILMSNALLGLPPVVVGLALYLLLSKSGPLGTFGLLFTPGAMIIAQAILATPIVAALVHRGTEISWNEYSGALRTDGASGLRSIPVLLAISRKRLCSPQQLRLRTPGSYRRSCLSFGKTPGSKFGCSPSARGKPSIRHGAAMLMWCWFMIRRQKNSSSPKDTASIGQKSPGMTLL